MTCLFFCEYQNACLGQTIRELLLIDCVCVHMCVPRHKALSLKVYCVRGCVHERRHRNIPLIAQVYYGRAGNAPVRHFRTAKQV